MDNKRLRLRAAFMVGTAVAAISTSPAFAYQAQLSQTPDPDAATQVNDVVVTARRVAERLQDVPVAVTAISGEDLTTQRIDNTEALRFVAPALRSVPQSSARRSPVIRSARSGNWKA